MLICTAIILSRNIAINVNAIADYRAEHHLIARIVSSVRSSNSHTDLLLTQQHHHPTFSDHTGPQHWTFTF